MLWKKRKNPWSVNLEILIEGGDIKNRTIKTGKIIVVADVKFLSE